MGDAIIDDELAGAEVRVLARGLRVLRVFERRNRWLSNREIAAITLLPRTTVSRLTSKLAATGYLLRSPETAKYQLGYRIADIGGFDISEATLMMVACPLLEEIVESAPVSVIVYKRVGASLCSLGLLGAGATAQERERYDTAVSLDASDAGCALLAMLPQAEQRAILSEAKDIESLRSEIEAAATQIAKKGFAVGVRNSAGGGLSCVSVVMRVHEDGQWFAFELLGHADQISVDRLDYDLGPALVRVKRVFELEFGKLGLVDVDEVSTQPC